MRLEEIYENQLYKRPIDIFDDKIQKLASAVNSGAIKVGFIAAKLALEEKKDKNMDFYTYREKQLSELEDQYFDFVEKFNTIFGGPAQFNHPNPDNRKDIYG
jgi:hypothetical protein